MKKGFVLVETIVVICVLCVILVMLYGSYSNILTVVQNKSLYDNTEYLYKTNVIRNYLEPTLGTSTYLNNIKSNGYYVYCSDLTTKCSSKDTLYEMMGVKAIYITIWTISKNSYDLTALEATTQNYIKYLNPTNEAGYRIIVMYESENNSGEYEYASLKYESE